MKRTTCRSTFSLLTGAVFLGWSSGAAAQGQGSWGGATGLVSAIGMLLLLGVLVISVITGFVGYGLGYPPRYKPLFALAGGLAPIVAIVMYFVNLDRNNKEARAALIEANKAVIRVAQERIDATCAGLQAREPRTVDLQRSVQRRVVTRSTALDVPPSVMDWPLPMNRVVLAFDTAYQNDLRRLRFEQSYFERHRVNDMSKQIDYVEHADEDGRLYAVASAAYWRTLVPRLDDESRQELSGSIGRGAANHFIGHQPRKPLARYGLEVSDVSTREDRNHWTARIRAKVFDTTSGDELFTIERALPILIDALGDRTGGVRLCAKQGHDAVANDRNFDWLGYLAREVSAGPRN
ncbi:MAG: hypothetical protein HEQ39_01965 [Rhizobacter sp.]